MSLQPSLPFTVLENRMSDSNELLAFPATIDVGPLLERQFRIGGRNILLHTSDFLEYRIDRGNGHKTFSSRMPLFVLPAPDDCPSDEYVRGTLYRVTAFWLSEGRWKWLSRGYLLRDDLGLIAEDKKLIYTASGMQVEVYGTLHERLRLPEGHLAVERAGIITASAELLRSYGPRLGDPSNDYYDMNQPALVKKKESYVSHILQRQQGCRSFPSRAAPALRSD
jgi:hypothetical protein